MKILSVLIVNSHRLFREGLRGLFEERSDFRVAGDVDDIDEAIDIIARETVDVVIVDLVLAGVYRRKLIRDMRAQRSGIRILVLTRCSDLANATNAFADHANGFLSMGCDFDELVRAVRHIDAGGRYLCADIAHELAIKAIYPGNRRLPLPLPGAAIGESWNGVAI